MTSEGFTPEPMHYRLTFADERLAGLQVTIRSVSIRRRISFNKTRFALPKTNEEADRYVQDIYAELCDRIVDWNLTDELGGKVPKTVDGLLDQHDYVVEEIVKAWIGVVDAQPRADADVENPTREFDPGGIPMESV